MITPFIPSAPVVPNATTIDPALAKACMVASCISLIGLIAVFGWLIFYIIIGRNL